MAALSSGRRTRCTIVIEKVRATDAVPGRKIRNVSHSLMNPHSDDLDVAAVRAGTVMIAGLSASRSTMMNASR